VNNGNGRRAVGADEADGDDFVIIGFSDKQGIGARGICVNADVSSCSGCGDADGRSGIMPMDEAVSATVEHLTCMVLVATNSTKSDLAV
jgi:hypothetical protein